MKSVACSSTGVLRLHASVGAQSRRLSLNVRPCSSAAAIEAPATLSGGTTSAHGEHAKNREQPMELSLGPLPLVEQRFHVSRRRYQASPSFPQQEQQHQRQGKYHPEEFVLLAPEDVDEVIDLYFERGHMDADPYWVRAWPSALALASTVLDYPELVCGKRVADLGAGLGVAGIAAALAGAREVVLLDREPLALQCGLASALATLRGEARVEGLQVGSPLIGSSSSSSSSSTRSSSGVEITGSSSYSQKPDKATMHHCWKGLPLPSFWFHGPDLHKSIPNTANLGVEKEEHAAQAGSHSTAECPAAGDLELSGEGQRAPQAGKAMGRDKWHRTEEAESSGDAQRAADCDRAGSHGSDSSHFKPQNGGSIGSSDCISINGSSSSSSSSIGSFGDAAGVDCHERSQKPHIWSFPLDWGNPELVEQLAQRCSCSCSSSSRSSNADGSRGGGGDGWSSNRMLRSSTSAPFDVVLACDVLYEASAVQPIARIIPKLLRPQDGVLLLADPPNRTVANRERFMRLVAGGREDDDGTENNGLHLTVKEQWIAPCHIHDLDNEMVGGLSAQGADQAPVQLHVMKCKGVGEDTIGLKL